MMAEVNLRIELPPLTVNEERLVATIRGHEHLYDNDIHDYLLFVGARREVTDTVAKERCPAWPDMERGER